MRAILKRCISFVLAGIILTIGLTGCGNVKNPSEAALSVADNYRTYYEVFVYSFYDSNGDGIGDINGVTQKLDYISDMGFTGLWLMPINPSTTYHKYDVIDYYSIDSQYGTLEDFKKLLEECSKRNIKVILDLVLNHTSTQNEWFKSAADDKNSPYRGFYNFADEKPVGGKYYPTGKGTGYYEAMFWDQMPDLNLSNKALRTELEKIMKYWLDMGVGGFRLDAAKEFFSGEPNKNIEVLSWINEYCKSIKPDCYIVGEVWEDLNIAAPYYQSGIDSFFNFSQASAKGKLAQTLLMDNDTTTAQAYAKSLVSDYNIIKENGANGIDAPFFTNHDSARAAGFMRRDPELIKLAWGLNMMSTGTSFLYYGEELGMSGSGKDENKRAPMLWSTTDKTGITNPPPSMEAQEHSFEGADIQAKDYGSIRSYIKRAVTLRNEIPALSRGIPEFIGDSISEKEIAVIQKTTDNEKIIVVYQLSDETKAVDLSSVLDNVKLKLTGKLTILPEQEKEITLNKSILTMPKSSIAILLVENADK